MLLTNNVNKNASDEWWAQKCNADHLVFCRLKTASIPSSHGAVTPAGIAGFFCLSGLHHYVNGEQCGNDLTGKLELPVEIYSHVHFMVRGK